MKKTSFKMQKKVKYLGITMTNMNCVLFQNNCVKEWNEIQMGEATINIVEKNFQIKMNVLHRMMSLFQTIQFGN